MGAGHWFLGALTLPVCLPPGSRPHHWEEVCLDAQVRSSLSSQPGKIIGSSAGGTVPCASALSKLSSQLPESPCRPGHTVFQGDKSGLGHIRSQGIMLPGHFSYFSRGLYFLISDSNSVMSRLYRYILRHGLYLCFDDNWETLIQNGITNDNYKNNSDTTTRR